MVCSLNFWSVFVSVSDSLVRFVVFDPFLVLRLCRSVLVVLWCVVFVVCVLLGSVLGVGRSVCCCGE